MSKGYHLPVCSKNKTTICVYLLSYRTPQLLIIPYSRRQKGDCLLSVGVVRRWQVKVSVGHPCRPEIGPHCCKPYLQPSFGLNRFTWSSRGLGEDLGRDLVLISFPWFGCMLLSSVLGALTPNCSVDIVDLLKTRCQIPAEYAVQNLFSSFSSKWLENALFWTKNSSYKRIHNNVWGIDTFR